MRELTDALAEHAQYMKDCGCTPQDPEHCTMCNLKEAAEAEGIDAFGTAACLN